MLVSSVSPSPLALWTSCWLSVNQWAALGYMLHTAPLWLNHQRVKTWTKEPSCVTYWLNHAEHGAETHIHHTRKSFSPSYGSLLKEYEKETLFFSHIRTPSGKKRLLHMFPTGVWREAHLKPGFGFPARYLLCSCPQTENPSWNVWSWGWPVWQSKQSCPQINFSSSF